MFRSAAYVTLLLILDIPGMSVVRDAGLKEEVNHYLFGTLDYSYVYCSLFQLELEELKQARLVIRMSCNLEYNHILRLRY